MNFDKIIKINVKGRNIDRFLKRVIKRKIHFIKVIPVSGMEINIILKYVDYLELVKYKSILYKISVIDELGMLRVKKKFIDNKILILFMIMGLVLLYMLSNVIFKVDVIHQNKDIRELVYNELDRYGIGRFSFKKSYYELEKIEDNILNNNKDRLEWLEIIVDGTFVKVRVEERLINKKKDSYQYQDIVASKNAVISSVNAFRGDVLKEKGIYVKKGDVVISGRISYPNGSNGFTMASGDVLGEVWYEVDIDYPFVYQESNLTGEVSSGIIIKFFDKKINLFGNSKYRSFSRKNKVLFNDNFLGLEVIFEKRYELDIKDEVYTEELVFSRATNYVKDKMMKGNSNIKDILRIDVMSKDVDYDGIKFKLFVTTRESIGEVRVIEDILNDEVVDN